MRIDQRRRRRQGDFLDVLGIQANEIRPDDFRIRLHEGIRVTSLLDFYPVCRGVTQFGGAEGHMRRGRGARMRQQPLNHFFIVAQAAMPLPGNSQ